MAQECGLGMTEVVKDWVLELTEIAQKCGQGLTEVAQMCGLGLPEVAQEWWTTEASAVVTDVLEG